ncbi:MAG TPA: LysR family transcriptional regulator [Gammaproteobacteria bacterium]|nr:LysR family transcriptional regulator [Gammaproteobacteria bacterium]
MDDLRRMVIFSHVVEAKSFSAAAQRLGIAKSAVSRHITLLEKSVGVRLLNRTTRSLNLTEIGETYYQGCARIVAEAEEVTRRISTLQDQMSGTLRVASPIVLGKRYIAPLLADFVQQHQSLHVELVLEDQVVDMVESGIDVGVRVGWLKDSMLLARKIAESPRLLCASPGYIERMGKPEHPEQLTSHDWIIFTLLPTPYHWTFVKNKSEKRIQVKGKVKTNNADAVRSFLLNGTGLAALSSFLVADDIKKGRLVQLLPDYNCGSAGIYAVYQDRRYQQAKVRLFIDYINEQFAGLLPG